MVDNVKVREYRDKSMKEVHLNCVYDWPGMCLPVEDLKWVCDWLWNSLVENNNEEIGIGDSDSNYAYKCTEILEGDKCASDFHFVFQIISLNIQRH